MSLDEVIAYFRQCRAGSKESAHASDRVYQLLDAYDERGREAELAIIALRRLMLPAVMTIAEAELVGEPCGDDAILFTFMGSGASDMVTFGQFRRAMQESAAFLEKHGEQTGENDGQDQIAVHARSGGQPQSLPEP